MLLALGVGAYLVWRFGVSKALAQQDESTAAAPPDKPPTGWTGGEGVPTWAQKAEEGA